MHILNNIKFYVCCFVCVSALQIQAQTEELPLTSVSFKKVHLLDKYITEGASIGDINADGHPDIIAGAMWWKGPKFKKKFAYAPIKYYPITGPGLEGYATNFFTFPDQFNDDKWTDILRIGIPGTDSKWVKNPGKKPKCVEKVIKEPVYFDAQKHVCHESPNLINVVGDDKKELLAFSNGQITLGIPNENDQKEWETLAISPQDSKRFPVFIHGLGAGDINKDGLTDIIEKSGWWEQPKNWNRKTVWTYHEYPFSPEQGGAQMLVFDVDGDGDNDVVTAMNAHSYGLSWHEQININNSVTFTEHEIMTNSKTANKYGVSFSQLHALDYADIDGDGVMDIVTGKCFYAHNGRDPGAEDPAVLYWFKTKRLSNGTVEFIPYLIDDNSGVGRQISTGDLNNDGKIDIVVGNKKGVFAFIQH